MPPVFWESMHVKKYSSRPKLPKDDGKTSAIFFLRAMTKHWS
jgi:hypothetical protein